MELEISGLRINQPRVFREISLTSRRSAFHQTVIGKSALVQDPFGGLIGPKNIVLYFSRALAQGGSTGGLVSVKGVIENRAVG